MRGLSAQYPGPYEQTYGARYIPLMIDGNEYLLLRVRERAFDAVPYPDEMVQHLSAEMGRPVVLMSDRSCRVYGPDHVAAYLSRRPVWSLPWRRARRYHD